MKRSVLGILLVGTIFFIAGQAQATIIDFSSSPLSGIVGNAVSQSANIGTGIYNSWSTSLTGFPDNPTTVNNGDTINATVQLDQSLTIPTSGPNPGSYTILSLYLTSSTTHDPLLLTDTDPDYLATVSFYNGGNLLETLGAARTTTSSQIVPSILFFPPNNGPITFDKLVFSGFDTNITGDGSSLSLDGGFLYYANDIANPATPEPPAFLLFCVGLLLLIGTTKFPKRVLNLA